MAFFILADFMGMGRPVCLDESGNPHPTGGVIGTGYAGPEWEWP